MRKIKTQIAKDRSEEWVLLLTLQKGEYYEKFYVNKFSYWDKNDKFLAKYKLTKTVSRKSRKSK